MVRVGQPGGSTRAHERGGILLVVLILAVTCSLLAVALVSSAEVALRADANADDLERAERAARSGVEWAAARVKAGGLLATSGYVQLDTGVEVMMEVRALSLPELLGTGRSRGAEVKVGADADSLEPGKPYAFSSYSGTSTLAHAVTIVGPAWFGANSAPLAGAGSLGVDGDVDLVTTTPLASGLVTHASGTTNYGQAARAMPAWNTLPFATDVGWRVPIHRYSGNTTLANVTLTGLVVVSLAANQTLTLRDVTIHGTLVVPWLYPPVLDVLGTTTIELRGDVVIDGGTAQTGNLALLAPGSKVLGHTGLTSAAIAGVTYVLALDHVRDTQWDGMVLARQGILRTSGSFKITRRAGFLPDVPVGIEFASGSQLLIAWRGRQ